MLGVIFSLLAVSTAHSAVMLQDLRSRLTDPTQNLFNVGAGRACTVMPGAHSALPCNPAFAATNEDKNLSVRGFFGNDYETIRRTYRVVDQELTSDDTRWFLDQTKPLQMETSLEIVYRRPQLGFSVVPERHKFDVLARNSAYPVAAIQALRERSFTMQVGEKLDPSEFQLGTKDKLLVGAQLRYANRQFVRSEFSALDTITESRSQLFPVRRQNAFYFEPGVVYVHGSSWEPRSSVLVTQTGWADKRFDETSMDPELDLGWGITPPVGFGRWDLGLNYHFLTNQQNSWDTLRLATSYTLKAFQVLFGADNLNQSAGILTKISIFEVGVLYSRDRYRVLDNKFNHADAYYGQLGVRF